MSVINIGLTLFISFILKRSGTARARYVREIKYSTYHPAKDYWKLLRDNIIAIHSSDKSLNELDDIIKGVSERRRSNYRMMTTTYKSFFEDKNIKWFDPRNSVWTFENQLNIRANPEIGLYIDGEPYLIKLYFRGDSKVITNQNISSTLTLMNTAIFWIGYT